MHMTKGSGFLDFKVNREYLPKKVKILGKERVGGKAKGLIFSQLAFESEGPPEMPNLEELNDLGGIRFPRSTVLATDFFDGFMADNNLEDVVYRKCSKEIEMQEMNRIFMNAETTGDLRKAMGKILESESGPLIVRSSSLLEDNVDYSFAGVYLSIFLTNQGTSEERMSAFSQAIKEVYASTYNANAKAYRKKHEIPWQREKMALLIQNVIGQIYPDNLFYPLFAGVAFSKSFYRWTDKISIDDGVVRIVVGLGTAAVGRGYARVFSPGRPELRPEGMDVANILRYSQTTIDALDMAQGFRTHHLDGSMQNPDLYKVCSILKEYDMLMDAPSVLTELDRIVPTFNPILKFGRHIKLVPVIRHLFSGLEKLFGIPVDIEFAINFERRKDGDSTGQFYLLQVRPLGARPEHSHVQIPEIDKTKRIIETKQVLGNGVLENIRHVVYVSPDIYNFEIAYKVAREIGEVNALLDHSPYILIGPGRWGTSNPQLGVPIHYFEISNAKVIVEIASRRFTPEVSYGTHFFGDLLSANIIYIPVFTDKGDLLNKEFLERTPSALRLKYVRLLEVAEGVKVFADGENNRALIIAN
jgi:hypothetical protein